MSTSFFKIQHFSEIKKLLLSEKVCILPTDAIYGLSALPTKKGVEEILLLKKRPFDQPFLLLVADFLTADRLAIYSPLAKHFFREIKTPLTLVLPRRKGMLSDFFPEKKTLALRVPRDTCIQKFLHILGKPLVSTSINVHGNTPLSSEEKIRAQFPQVPFWKKASDISLDKREEESTILSIEGISLSILRLGSVSEQEIKKVQEKFLYPEKFSELPV